MRSANDLQARDAICLVLAIAQYQESRHETFVLKQRAGAMMTGNDCPSDRQSKKVAEEEKR
jgi:hypothetical protein